MLAYANVFVVEPNLDAWPLDKLYFRKKSGCDTLPLGLPQLHIYRDGSGAIVEIHSSVHSVPASRLGNLECTFHCDAILGIMTIPCGTSTRRFLATVLKSETVASFPLHVTLDVSRGDISMPDLSLLDMDLSTAVQSAHFDDEWAVQPERAIMGAKKICLVPFDFPLDRLQSIVFPGGVLETYPGVSSTPSLLRDEPSLLREDGFFADRATSSEPRARPRSFSPMPRVEADEPDGAGRLSFYIGERAANLVRGIEKLLSSGFYFSYDVDFSRTLQHRALESASTNLSSRPQMLPCWRAVQTENVDPPPEHIFEMEQTRLKEPSYVDCWERKYLWNHHLVTPFIKAGVDLNWLVPITQGSVSSLFVEHPLHSVEMILSENSGAI